MQKVGSTHGTGSFFRVIFNFSARRIFPATLSKHCFLLSNCWCYVFFCYRKVSLVLLSYRYLKSLKEESRQISIIIFYNIEKNSKKYAKNIYKDTNVCYADAVTDRPFCWFKKEWFQCTKLGRWVGLQFLQGGSFMKKAKRLAIIVCAIAMLMSILAIPASAATQDH